MIDICICTHNPAHHTLHLVLDALLRQSNCRAINSLLIIDNGSNPALSANVIARFQQNDIPARVIVEPTPGLIHARIRAINETTSHWLLFVDDDNELAADYIECGLKFIATNPDVGCFGGKLLLPKTVCPPKWAQLFLPYLGIRDEGEQVIKQLSYSYGPWEPSGAGVWVHRKVADEFLRRITKQQELLRLGRKGSSGLASCEDSLMMRGAAAVGLKNAYVPQLVLWHHLDNRKFRIKFLWRLMLAYGGSHILLESSLAGQVRHNSCYESLLRTVLLMKVSFVKNLPKSVRIAIGSALYHYGAYKEYSRLGGKRV
jgi:glycosyltransferase involved in cell wall biosynthesis